MFFVQKLLHSNLPNAASDFEFPNILSGTPFAVHPLKDVKKIVTVTIETDKAEILGTDKQEKRYKFTFSLTESNQIKILCKGDE